MKDFQLCSWLICYDVSKISASLAISLKHNIILAKLLEILLDNNVILSLTHIRWRIKNHLEVIWVYIFQFFIKVLYHHTVFKNEFKISRHLGFRWLTKSIETIKFYNWSFCRCYSLCFYICMVKKHFFTSLEILEYFSVLVSYMYFHLVNVA